jgi:methionine synthase II (cobalamin-independent)
VPKNFAPNFTATGIGSLPHSDPLKAVAKVQSELTEMPYWPQLSKLGPMEDMNLQFARALRPLVGAVTETRELKAHPDFSREEALAGFYERLFGAELNDFVLNREEANGLYLFMDKVKEAGQESFPWLKGHVTGPLTLAASVIGQDEKSILYDDEMAEAVARGLGAAAAAQADLLGELGRPLMIFIDEPFLSGFGSAFTPISREKVIELLGCTLEEARARAAQTPIMGVHCCGNTDWGMLIEAGFDVINLDSAGYGEHLLLYPEAVKSLFEKGGAVAWGAVPTAEFKGDETGEALWAHLKGLLEGLEAKGIAKELLASQALVTPACGMGSLDEQKAARILELTAEVSRLARSEYTA